MSGEYPREPVPEGAANRPAKSIAMMVSSAAMGVPIMILGASLGGDYGAPKAWLVSAVGGAITALFSGLTAYAGVKSRRSTALLSRQTFGTSGAHLLNFAVAVALLGWFSVEMGFVGTMAAAGVENVFGVAIGREPGIVVASLLICIVCIFGIAMVTRVPLLFLPFLGALLLVVLFLALRMPIPPAVFPLEGKSIGTGISAIVGGYVVGCLIMPDYTRFIRTSRAAVAATMLSAGGVYALVLSAYALAGLATQGVEPSNILLGLGLPAAIGLVLPIGLMQNGIMCLYSSALATSTLVRAFSFKVIAIVLMLVGMGLALAGIESFFVKFLVILGVVFPPAAALLIYTGLFARLRVDADLGEWEWAEIAVWCFGILCGAASEYIGLGLTGFSAFDGFLGAAAAMAALDLFRTKRRGAVKSGFGLRETIGEDMS